MSVIEMEHTIDAGHRIVGHKGKCARLHGHTYRIIVQIAGEIVEPGFVVDFGDIKDILNQWDHRMLLWEEDGLMSVIRYGNLVENYGVILLPFNPTAENMAYHLAYNFSQLHNFIHWAEVEVWETPKASARSRVENVR